MSDQQQNNMWKNACILARLVSVSVEAAENAGTTIKKVMTSGNLQIVNKDLAGTTQDLQTEADRSAQAGIEAKLKSAFGDGIRIVGEEELPEQIATTDKNWAITERMMDVLAHDKEIPEKLRKLQIEDLLVWVDPLDGTGEFVRAQEDPSLLQQVTVLIGITHKGQPIAGVVHQPYYKKQGQAAATDGRTIWGICQVGAFGIDSQKEKPNTQLEAVTTASHSTKLVDDALDALKRNGLITSVKRVGGAGYKVLCCLEGATAYVYASTGCKKWDTAGPEAILKAAGGDLTDISGEQIDYAKIFPRQIEGVLATAPGVQHKKYVDAIPKDVKDALLRA